MKITEKFKAKAENLTANAPITIACLGDSVTQGCFDLYRTNEQVIQTYFDSENAYHAHLHKMLSMLFPNVPVNIINAGISGDSAPRGLARLERDVIKFSPDLCIVCFGLNDSSIAAESSFEDYTASMEKIFKTLIENNIEVIFMTPNMMCTSVSCHLTDEGFRGIAENTANVQNSGKLEKFLTAAKSIAKNLNIPVCDCYEKWIALHKGGVDITELLANRINHPTPQMNYLFAYSLLETIFKNQED